MSFQKNTRAEVNPTNPPASSEHSPPEDNQKDPPHPTSISKEPPASPEYSPPEDNPKDPPHPTKEPNLSINLGSGSNVADPQMNKVENEESSNLIGEGKETTIREIPLSTQISPVNTTPQKTN